MATDPRRRRTRAAAAAAAAAAEEAPVVMAAAAATDQNEEKEQEQQEEEEKPATTTRGIGTATNILFSTEDAMEEDEDIDLPMAPPSTSSAQPQQQQSSQLTSSATVSATTTTIPPYSSATTAATAATTTDEQTKLISKIITPSPFPQHNAGASSSRFRNALNRVTTSPTTDAEAWQALMTEVSSCYKSSLQSVHAVDAETHAKLDWIESCYGALLSTFPYAASYYCQIVEILMAQSARVGEEHGPLIDYGRALSQRSILCEAKVEAIFRTVLCVNMDGTPVVPAADSNENENQGDDNMNIDEDYTNNNRNDDDSSKKKKKKESLIGGMCTWSVKLWLLYIQKATRDANRKATSSIQDPDDRTAFIREATQKAYETALGYASFCHNNHLLWKQYLAYVRSWNSSSSNKDDVDMNNDNNQSASEHALQQKQMVQLRSIYQRLVCLPMTGLDQLWQEYEQFEKNQSEALAQALISEFQPKYQHARTVYLERQRVYGGMMAAQSDLEYDRLAVEPVYQSDDDDGKDNEGGGETAEEEEYATKRQEEYKLLQVWKVRCSYERSNPERLSSRDLAQRIRTAYKELASVWTRHPECWHMWSMWELLHSESLITEQDKVDRARATLQMGQSHVPDCTLLAYAEAQIVEDNHNNSPSSSSSSECVTVMENFLRRSPNTLGFVLCQQMVRRCGGIEDARAVFGRARRILVNPDASDGDNHNAGSKEDGDNKKGGAGVAANTEADGQTGQGEKSGTTGATAGGQSHHHDDGGKKRWMVTNRLDPSITGDNPASTKATKQGNTEATATNDDNAVATATAAPAGPITWHLYAAHAVIEHRLNKLPEVAARVYELGLRKHSSFITKPPYVLRYAQLLLELGDAMNLRALLTRAVAACESQLQQLQENQQQQTKHQQHQQQELQAALATFWDMTLRFEAMLSTEDQASTNRLHEIESKRRQAVLGADVEDVATGGSLATSDVPLIGAQKATISEQLVRSEGYDISSNIVSGMSRTVDFLEVMGMWGSESSSSSAVLRRRANQEVSAAEISGGKSDASYQKRLHYQNLVAAGLSTESAAAGEGPGGVAGPAGTKVLSARERLQQGAAAGTGAGGQGQPTTAMMLAIQQSPEWLRPLLLLLPASRLRIPIVAKPPPHLTELALSSLKQSQLPERPADDKATTNGSNTRTKRMVRADAGADSSDDEDNGLKAGGYGNQFRTRKRTRMMENGPSI